MIHLIKLAVGIRDVAHLAAVQGQRAAENPPLRHATLFKPKRAAEICGGGSIYWVIGGAVLARQRVLDIIDEPAEGRKRAAFVLEPALIRTAARPAKAFQGWRYLTQSDAPPDLAATPAGQADDMPDTLRRALAALALL